MSLATDPLPANPSALRIFAADLQAELARKDIEIAANAAEIHAKTLHIEKLKMQLAVLRRARFGRSSEKLNRDIEQLELLIGALEQDAAAEEARTNTAEPDATLADWVGKAEFLLSPLAEAIGRHVCTGAALHADDTTVPVLAPGLGKTKTGRLWVVVRDERSWGSTVPPAAFYHYSADRKAIHAEALLGTCRGFLHADGYAGFERLYQPTTPDGEPPLVEVACWSHARRKLYEVHHATASPIAFEALERIAALFAIESSIRGRRPDQRVAAREEHARPLLVQLKAFLDTSLYRVSGKSALAQAIRYALSRWQALTRYVTDGRLEMSNNAAERAMKPPVLGRKNYLFCGSDAGGQRAACIYTIIETAKMCDINPQAYLTDVLNRIADHPIRQIDTLLPWRWAN